MKRLLIISDLHCGHRGGLTPPKWQYSPYDDDNVLGKFGKLQSTVWDWYAKQIESVGPVDLLVVNGDAIDGKGAKSGGVEQLTSDRREQCEIAKIAVDLVDRKKTLIIKGTPYHTSSEGEDWEDVLADMVRANDVGAHEWVEADGVIFDFKHKVGSSMIPHGRLTAPLRSSLWNSLWAEQGLQPRADVIVRSHVHYHVYGGMAGTMVMTTPCLQAWSKYGTVQCEGLIDLGMVLFECEKGGYTWGARLLNLEFMAAQSLRL